MRNHNQAIRHPNTLVATLIALAVPFFGVSQPNDDVAHWWLLNVNVTTDLCTVLSNHDALKNKLDELHWSDAKGLPLIRWSTGYVAAVFARMPQGSDVFLDGEVVSVGQPQYGATGSGATIPLIASIRPVTDNSGHQVAVVGHAPIAAISEVSLRGLAGAATCRVVAPAQPLTTQSLTSLHSYGSFHQLTVTDSISTKGRTAGPGALAGGGVR